MESSPLKQRPVATTRRTKPTTTCNTTSAGTNLLMNGRKNMMQQIWYGSSSSSTTTTSTSTSSSMLKKQPYSYGSSRMIPKHMSSSTILQLSSWSSMSHLVLFWCTLLFFLVFMVTVVYIYIQMSDVIESQTFNATNHHPYLQKIHLQHEQQQQQQQQQQQLQPELNVDRVGFQKYNIHAPKCQQYSSTDSNDDISYTLVTQCSDNRLWMMEHQCQRWQTRMVQTEDQQETQLVRLSPPPPISIAVMTNQTQQSIQRQLEQYGCDITTITVQIEPISSSSSHFLTHYPVNRLRNRALQAVQTSHVVYVDIDFWISATLYQTLHHPTVLQFFQKENQSALVLPAFQLNRQCPHVYQECPQLNIPAMPSTFRDLILSLKKNGAKTVSKFDPTNHGGHGSTLYKQWFFNQSYSLFYTDMDTNNNNTNKNNQETIQNNNHDYFPHLLQIPCFTSNRYEPYLVFPYCYQVPPFQEQFTGYGKNKMTWIMQLRRYGYTFYQLANAFVVHYPHLDSPARMEWNLGPNANNNHQTTNAESQQLQPQQQQFLRRTNQQQQQHESIIHNNNTHNSPNDNTNQTPTPKIDWLQYQRGQMDSIFVQFKTWMKLHIPDQSRTPLCETADDDDARLWIDRSS